MPDNLSSTQTFFEKLSAKFVEAFESPSSNNRCVRCVTKTKLLNTLIKIRDEIGIARYNKKPGKELIEHLIKSGLIHTVSIEGTKTKKDSPGIYLIGIEHSDSAVSPIELLQASENNGVICYFTAIQIHALSTQNPSHHHIARLISATRNKKNTVTRSIETGRVKADRSYDYLGTKQFEYQGIPYYRTNRDRQLVPGIQECYLNPKTLYRVTTLEQTLLDTLHRPLSCGGPAVVFEAWETSFRVIDEERLVKYLLSINDHKMSRRIGYILQERGYKMGKELNIVINQARESISRDDPNIMISLLNGIKYTHINEEWMIEVP